MRELALIALGAADDLFADDGMVGATDAFAGFAGACDGKHACLNILKRDRGGYRKAAARTPSGTIAGSKSSYTL
jgi:hypothetical protein